MRSTAPSNCSDQHTLYARSSAVSRASDATGWTSTLRSRSIYHFDISLCTSKHMHLMLALLITMCVPHVHGFACCSMRHREQSVSLQMPGVRWMCMCACSCCHPESLLASFKEASRAPFAYRVPLAAGPRSGSQRSWGRSYTGSKQSSHRTSGRRRRRASS